LTYNKCCDKINQDMKRLTVLRRIFKKTRVSSLTVIDHTQLVLNKQGKEQFKKLIDQGLQVPVGLL